MNPELNVFERSFS